MVKAFAAIDEDARRELAGDLLAAAEKFNVAKDGTAVMPSAYLEVVITKKS